MSTVPAIVVGLDLNGLGVVRSLGAARIPVIAIDTEPGKPTCTTRYASVRRAPALEGPPLVEALLRVREGLAENPVLLLTQEGSVATVSAERARLADAFRFSMPGDALMRQLGDKLGFQALAEGLGFSLPRAVRLGHGMAATLSDLRFPCVLKPVSKDAEYARRFRKAYRVSVPDEALGLWEEMRTVAPEVIVQEWIEGGDGDVYFCLQYRPPHGGSVTSFVGRKLRQWPPLVGGTACCVPAPEHAAELLAITDRFFSAVDFIGPCSMEYKRDRRDGTFYMVEPTVGRTDFQEEVATLNGVNIPLAAYRGERGLPPPAPRSRRACGWRDPFGDANARAAGAPDEPSRFPLRDAYWRLADPLPFMSVHTARVKRRLAAALPSSAKETFHHWQRRRALPPAAKTALAEDRAGLPTADMGPRAAITAATAWICRAQDLSRTRDGGVARDFSLIDGWAASYPETTGYIIPSLIAVARRDGRSELMERARRMLDWLVSIQLPGGGFQGGRVDQTPVVPVTFNTGQILLGLAAGVEAFGEAAYGDAMRAAARFLRDSQDGDGAWRRYPTPFAKPGDKAYETHVSWGLFEAARLAPEEGYGEAGLRQIRWALTRQRPNGWFADNCLENPAAPLTHTIGYVLRGVIEAHRYQPAPDLLAAALRTAEPLVHVLDPEGRLPGRLDETWRGAANYVCLTGTVQIAACWMLLADIAGRPDFIEPARRANAFVRRTVKIGGRPDIAGGVKGSFPVSGEYGRFQYLNWAAKFFIDANLMEQALPAGG